MAPPHSIVSVARRLNTFVNLSTWLLDILEPMSTFVLLNLIAVVASAVSERNHISSLKRSKRLAKRKLQRLCAMRTSTSLALLQMKNFDPVDANLNVLNAKLKRQSASIKTLTKKLSSLNAELNELCIATALQSLREERDGASQERKTEDAKATGPSSIQRVLGACLSPWSWPAELRSLPEW